MKLEEGAWFVRSNGGQGSYPVTRQGWLVVLGFLSGVCISAGVAALLANSGPGWLWIVVFAVGMAVSALAFILIARKRTDYSITVNELIARRKAGK